VTGIIVSAGAYLYPTVYPPGTTSITVPTDSTSVVMYLQAAGGAGGERDDIEGSGGGGGGFATLSRNVLSGEWGTTLTCTVGAGAVLTNGGNTTLSGTLNGSSVNVTCNGGTKGTAFSDGYGGSATGGDTNVSGQDGYGFVQIPFDERAPGFGGKAGGDGSESPLQGYVLAPGDGADGRLTGEGIAGFDGYIAVLWSY
jgi:hypothetical protein